MACAPSEDSYQPGHPSLRSPHEDQSLRCPHEESLGPLLPIERTGILIRLGGCTSRSESSEDSDQTGPMHRLI